MTMIVGYAFLNSIYIFIYILKYAFCKSLKKVCKKNFTYKKKILCTQDCPGKFIKTLRPEKCEENM